MGFGEGEEEEEEEEEVGSERRRGRVGPRWRSAGDD
jgi:hypothetical protein